MGKNRQKRLLENQPSKVLEHAPQPGAQPHGPVFSEGRAVPIPRQGPQMQATSIRVSASLSATSGPLPPPEILEQYGAVKSDIVAMARAEQQHRHAMEKAKSDRDTTLLEGLVAAGQRGQYLAGVIAVSGLGAAATLGIFGHPISAAIVGTVDLVMLVGLFLGKGPPKPAEKPALQASTQHAPPPAPGSPAPQRTTTET